MMIEIIWNRLSSESKIVEDAIGEDENLSDDFERGSSLSHLEEIVLDKMFSTEDDDMFVLKKGQQFEDVGLILL
jgi:hypothetical protein